MSEIVRLEQVTSWKRVLNAARRTIGKEPLDKEPSNSWKAKMLLAEHSPIRLLEYDFSWKSIKQWVTTHLVRHHEGCEKMVHTQREDRRVLLEEYGVTSRDELPQGALNDMDMSANAQALINISRKRLCSCASADTREAWKQVKVAVAKIDPVLADKMVPECIYRGFCPEFLSSCGYSKTPQYQEALEKYRSTDYE
nr:MAG TPA: Thymidylate synthase thyX [Bacteriophage sp.]